MKERRCKLFEVNGFLLSAFFGEGHKHYVVQREPIPKDAVIVGAHYDVVTGRTLLLLESDSFEPVPHGNLHPYISPSVCAFDVPTMPLSEVLNWTPGQKAGN
jgi:hypothetical protein